MKKTISYIAGALMLLIPAVSGAQSVPLAYTVTDYSPVTLAKGSAGLTETKAVSHAAFTNAAAISFAESTLDVSAGYMLWQPSTVKTNVANAAAAYRINDRVGVAAGLYFGINPSYEIMDASGVVKSEFAPKDIHAAVGVSYKFVDFLSAGVNLGYANSSLTPDNSYGSVTADVFVMSKISDYKVTLGVSNVFGSVKSLSGDRFSVPGSLALGGGYDKTFAGVHAVEANVDLDYFFSSWFAAAAGAGYTYNDLVSVRAGYRYGGGSPFPSFASVGVGGKYMGIKLDVAYLIYGADSTMKNTLAVSLGYTF